MTETAGSAAEGRADAKGGGAGILRAAALGRGLSGVASAFRDALEIERGQRRFFLWVPVALGAGIALYFTADREPVLPLTVTLTLALAVVAALLREHRRAFMGLVGMATIFGGMAAAGLRTAWLAAPVLDRTRIVDLQGYIEEMNFRREGARFILRVAAADGLETQQTPFRVRISTRRTPPFEAGAFVELKARLLPPSRAAEPGGYDFSRDAWFAQIGAVGNVLGRIEDAVAPEPPGAWLAANMAIDRARNALARRVDAIVGGDAGAIAAAMVTGKRDLLSEDAKNLIREAGIFHVITISGVQMTLVAGIFFIGLRRILALSRTLALRYPIKKWAAGAAIIAAVAYDIMTGSRIGTERALAMTLIMLVAVILDRHALTMRNLAFAALIVLLLQPEALLGASFQLSFAAVAALVAVYEGRAAADARKAERRTGIPADFSRRGWFGRPRGHGFRHAVIATLCATTATASFMAYDFHEVNPYVIVGNPLTFTIIEVFAVPGAILGTLLYPLGLDALVWHWVGFGISIIMRAARIVGSLPGSSLHLPAFAPWSLVFLSLGVLFVVIWRTTLLRLLAVPLVLIGVAGAIAGPTFDIAVAAGGDAAAIREAGGRLAVIGQRPSAFAAEQWLRGDADGRSAKEVIRKDACDKLGCIGRLADGRAVAIVLDASAFAEDCRRATIVVTPLFAPIGCAAKAVIDRGSLKQTGAVTLSATAEGFRTRSARGADEDRPWSPASKRPWTYRVRASSEQSVETDTE